MIGHVEPQDLRRAEQQRGLDLRRVGRSAALEQPAEQVPQRAQPPQHQRDQRAHQRAVAVGERCQAGMRLVVELLVERPAPLQHRREDVGRDAAGGEPGRLDGRRGR